LPSLPFESVLSPAGEGRYTSVICSKKLQLVRLVFRDFSSIVSQSRFLRQASGIWKGGLVRDLEDFEFLHCELPRPREKSSPELTVAVRVRATTVGSEIVNDAGVCVAVIKSTNVTTVNSAG
jgi:hypothetical protein